MSRDDSPSNLIDRAIEWLAPGWAASRYRARSVLNSYRGAIRTRAGNAWGRSVSYKGGRNRDRLDQAEMSDRARAAYSNNPIARSLLNAETDAVVSDGYWFLFNSSSPDWNTEAEARFYAWLDKADITGKAKGAELMRQSWREPRKDGDGLMVLITRGGYPKLQYIPRDLICNPYTGYDYRTMKDGVEIDDAGRPVRFWIRDVDEAGKDTVTSVDARDCVYWAFRDDDPMTTRGTTVFATIFFILDQLDAYIDAVTKAAIMAAIFGLIEKRKNPAAAIGPLGTQTNTEGQQQKAVTLDRDGMIKVIGTEESVFQVQAMQPMSQTPDFIRALLRLAGLAFDMPLEMGMKDFSQVNFSGGQLGMKAFEQSCRIKQTWHMTGWKQIAFWWASVERKRQQLGYADAMKTPFPDDYGQIELYASEFLLRDRYGEAKADLLEIAIGVSSPQQACRRRSVEHKKVFAERLIAWKDNEAAGLPNLLSNDTRDAKTAVTAVDADGNPVGGGDGAPLNGIQITSAIEILTKVTEKLIESSTAIELISRLGINPAKATEMVTTAANRKGISAGDRDFQREILKSLLTVPAAREAVYNQTDIEDLVAQSGLPQEKGIQAPFIPVVAPAGQLVSGEVIKDPDGDIVGGDVTNTEAPNAPTGGGGSHNGDPGQGSSSNEQQQAPAPADDPGGKPNE